MLRGIINFMIASMIFFPDSSFYEKPQDYGIVHEDVYFETSDGVRLHGWYLKGLPEKGVILHFHGNAGNISHRVYKAEGWVRRGFSVFLVDYRGYGKSEGKIRHQDDVMLDADAAFSWLVNEKKVPVSKIIPFGESLGTHPAIRLAVEHPVGAVILEAAYTSFVALGKRHYPFVPASWIQDFAFPNLDYISRIQSPLFVMHGTEDEICPYAMAGELFELAPNPKEFFSVTGGRHNDLPIKAGEDYWEKPYQFVMKQLGQQKED